jgi:alpha-galactosidase
VSAARFHYLRGGESSLLLDARPDEASLPRIVHFGADLGPQPDLQAILDAGPKVMWGARLDQPRPPCVLPGAEDGYFGAPAIDPTRGLKLQLQDVTSSPASILLRLSTVDAPQVFLGIEYRLSPHGVLSVRSSLRGSATPEWLAAMALPLPSHMEELITLGGDWAREFAMHRQVIGTAAAVLESRRGRPGHDRFPGLFVGERGFGDDHGDVVGVTLGWSGSHRLSVERLREGQLIVQAGELFTDGDNVPSTYESPWCHAVQSARGLNGAMQALHAFLRDVVIPANVSSKPRPVHYNTWEAIYFKHDLATLKDLANRAAQVGAERFVLDDGWFKGRNDDRAGLGDWTVDAAKYPDGLGPLIAHVRSLGLEFGLWVEPEMINPDSDLARAHPDWIRQDKGALLLMRNQAVLDMGRKDVRDHLFAALDALLAKNEISYLKWDMNREVTGGGHHAYVTGVHDLIDRLRAAHPKVEIETCASGGGRCDYGMLSRAERVWVSDSNDALDRFDIQRNANLFLAPEISGVHVGPASCHITGRKLSLELRAHVALFGHMGLELDLRQLDDAELARLTQHIATYKAFRPLLHSGRWWRITPSGPDHSAVAVSSADGNEALCLLLRTGSEALGRGTLLRLPGLEAARDYRVLAAGPHAPHVEQSLGHSLRSGNLRLSGRVLSARGLDLYLPRPDSSLLLHVKPA